VYISTEDEDSEVKFAPAEQRRLVAVDTPSQRAIVRAYHRAVEGLQEQLQAAVGKVRETTLRALSWAIFCNIAYSSYGVMRIWRGG
jgi:hypothetical protein